MLIKLPTEIKKRASGLCFPLPVSVVNQLDLVDGMVYDMEVTDDGKEIRFIERDKHRLDKV